MKNNASNRKWHWIFWLVYFLANHAIFSYNFFDLENIFINSLFFIHNAGAAYMTLDWWYPKFYKRRKYWQFGLAIVATVVVFSVLLSLSLTAAFHFLGVEDNWLDTFSEYSISLFFSNLNATLLLLIPHLILEKIAIERKQSQLEKEKLTTELKALKNQLNPHFLFNALNNIYFLIKKDPDLAAEALAGFSDILRFQLYETDKSFIPLKKEITYLRQFTEIAKLRKDASFSVNWELPTTLNGTQIAPLLLMPLVENAFKHGKNKDGSIDIQLQLSDNLLRFQVVNNREDPSTQTINGYDAHGIGLQNIQKRLELIYPQKYQLQITEQKDTFAATLELQLDETAHLSKKPKQ